MPGDFEKVAEKKAMDFTEAQRFANVKVTATSRRLSQTTQYSIFEERELEDGLMRPDFFIESTAVADFLLGERKAPPPPDANPTKDVVLVDGPHHFAISASTGHRTLLGSTAMRNFLLKERLGLRLGVILFDEWGELQVQQKETNT